MENFRKYNVCKRNGVRVIYVCIVYGWENAVEFLLRSNSNKSHNNKQQQKERKKKAKKKSSKKKIIDMT